MHPCFLHARAFNCMLKHAYNGMRCFHQNIFSNLIFRLEDVRPAQTHSIACSCIRMHAKDTNACIRDSKAVKFYSNGMLVYKGVHVNPLVI
jgi:hypothetical protein